MLKKLTKILLVLSIVLSICGITSFTTNKIKADEKPSQKAVFVGDDTLKGMSKIADKSRFTWIYENRKGLTWVKIHEEEFKKELSNNGTALVFSVGLSEVSNVNKVNNYISYYNTIAGKLENDTKVYVKSIDPVDESKYGSKVNSKIKEWNERVKKGLSDKVTFIDTYSFLEPSYKTQANGYYFSDDTNHRILNFMLEKMNMPTDEQYREKQNASIDLAESGKNSWGRDKSGKRVYYDEKGEIVKNGFRTIDDSTYYFDREGHYLTGLHKIEGNTVFFNSAGIMKKNGTATVDEEGHIMLFDGEGHQLTGWQTMNGKKYYIGADRWCLIGWWTLETTDYYFKEDGSAATGIVKIKDGYYLFNNDGSARVGWYEEGGDKYYFGEGGKMVIGKTVIDGKHYRFGKTGKMVFGWFDADDGRYYYDKKTGVALSGNHKIGGKTYNFTKEGKIASGWITLRGSKYYFKKDGSNYTGHTKIGEKYYFFDSKGKALSGWQKEKGVERYYSEDDFAMLTGWQKIEGKKYYFKKDGSHYKGIKIVDGAYRYFNSSGRVLFSVPVFIVIIVIIVIVLIVLNSIYGAYKEQIDPYLEKWFGKLMNTNSEK